MAEDTHLNLSVTKASDTAFEFACTPCSDDKKDVEAINYCVNCQSYFCGPCLRDHNKFRAMKGHKILDQTAMIAGTYAQAGTQQLMQPAKLSDCCNDHPGNVIQMYCSEHDVVCCTVCIAVDHRLCNGVDFIPKVAKGIHDKHDIHEVRTSLETVRGELEQLRSKKKDELLELNRTLEDILKEIDSLKKCILIQLDHLETRAIVEAKDLHNEIAQKLDSNVNNVDVMLKTLDTQLDNITHCSEDNEAKIFVHVKSGQKLKTSCKRYVDEVKHINADKIVSDVNTAVENVLNENQSLVNLKIIEQSKKYRATLDRQINVRVKEDSSVCCIYDICPLDDDQFVITDFTNEKLKRMDKSFIVTDVLKIPGNPLGICRTTRNELAVTLWGKKKVQFVSVDKPMSLTRSFDVPVKCKGISHFKEKLYICCYGMGIGVYDLSGNILCKFETDQSGNTLFYDPCMLTLSSDGKLLRVAASKEGVVTLDEQGKKVSVSTDQNLKYAFGICQVNAGQIFVSGFRSNNIVQMDKDGTVLQELLDKSNGIKSPYAVIYLKNPDRLLVSSYNCDEITVFKLT